MSFLKFFRKDKTRHTLLYSGHVVPDLSRCVQCGICSESCPVDIDVRAHVWRNEAVISSACLTCGECVARCPRGVLSFVQTDLFNQKDP